MSATAERAPKKGSVIGGLGIIVHCTIVAFVYYLSVAVVPLEVAYSLWALWAVFLALAVYLMMRRPAWALAIPFLAYAVWVGVISLGEWLFGWTA